MPENSSQIQLNIINPSIEQQYHSQQAAVISGVHGFAAQSADLSVHTPIANGTWSDRICDENSLIATVAAGSSARNAEYPLKRQGDVTWRLAKGPAS